jgi:hypothetical protein
MTTDRVKHTVTLVGLTKSQAKMLTRKFHDVHVSAVYGKYSVLVFDRTNESHIPDDVQKWWCGPRIKKDNPCRHCHGCGRLMLERLSKLRNIKTFRSKKSNLLPGNFCIQCSAFFRIGGPKCCNIRKYHQPQKSEISSIRCWTHDKHCPIISVGKICKKCRVRLVSQWHEHNFCNPCFQLKIDVKDSR